MTGRPEGSFFVVVVFSYTMAGILHITGRGMNAGKPPQSPHHTPPAVVVVGTQKKKKKKKKKKKGKNEMKI
jgi:hypothetical protein